jgi:hypothetical protein
MWLTPQTLLWPAYGWTFPKVDLTDWLPGMLDALVTNSAVFLPELIGGAVLIWFVVILVRRRSVSAFIKRGNL